jgi:ferredoxin--NADP+ reductase
VLCQYATGDRALSGPHITLRFQRSPLELPGDGRAEQMGLGRNELRVGPGGWVSADDTGEGEVVETGVELRAVGYRGFALPGLPFDERRGVIPIEQGKITGSEREYVVGWIKRVPPASSAPTRRTP